MAFQSSTSQRKKNAQQRNQPSAFNTSKTSTSTQSANKPKRGPLTEEEAKAKGLSRLPCCGKVGTHNPNECRSKKHSSAAVNQVTATAQPATNTKLNHQQPSKAKSPAVESVAAVKGPSFYDDDIAFVLVESSERIAQLTTPSSRPNIATLYLDTGASSNAVPLNSPLVRDVHPIAPRDVVGVGHEACSAAGYLSDFGFALLVPSLTLHLVSLSYQRAHGMNIEYKQDEDCFELSKQGKTFVFTLRENKLYGFDQRLRSPASSIISLKVDRVANGKSNISVR